MATASNPRFIMQEDSIMSIGHFLLTQRNTHTRAKMMKQLITVSMSFMLGLSFKSKGKKIIHRKNSNKASTSTKFVVFM